MWASATKSVSDDPAHAFLLVGVPGELDVPGVLPRYRVLIQIGAKSYIEPDFFDDAAFGLSGVSPRLPQMDVTGFAAREADDGEIVFDGGRLDAVMECTPYVSSKVAAHCMVSDLQDRTHLPVEVFFSFTDRRQASAYLARARRIVASIRVAC